MNPSIPKVQSGEYTPGQPQTLPGTYKNKKNGRLYITVEGREGVIQADALMSNPQQKGEWERIGDVPSRIELLEARKAQELKDATETAVEEEEHKSEIEAAVAAVKNKKGK